MLKQLLAVTALFFVAQHSSAATLFYEDFESDLSQWSANTGSLNGSFGGVIVDDPLQTDRALTFSQLDGSIDIWTTSINNPTGSYILSFDYLGTCQTTNCGGFIWNSITGWNGTTYPYPDTLPDTGRWEHVQISFTGVTSIQLGLEDWNGSGGTFGDAYFDNIELTDQFGSSRETGSVPVSNTIALMLIGLSGLATLKRYQKSNG